MGDKFEELKAIAESLYEWAVKHGEQSYMAVAIMDDQIKAFNDLELPEGKQFDLNRWDGQWWNGKTPAAESAGESKINYTVTPNYKGMKGDCQDGN